MDAYEFSQLPPEEKKPIIEGMVDKSIEDQKDMLREYIKKRDNGELVDKFDEYEEK